MWEQLDQDLLEADYKRSYFHWLIGIQSEVPTQMDFPELTFEEIVGLRDEVALEFHGG